MNVFPQTVDTKMFEFPFQNGHSGASGPAAVKQLLVVPPHPAESDVTFQPYDCFVLILQDEVNKIKVLKRRCNVKCLSNPINAPTSALYKL